MKLLSIIKNLFTLKNKTTPKKSKHKTIDEFLKEVMSPDEYNKMKESSDEVIDGIKKDMNIRQQQQKDKEDNLIKKMGSTFITLTGSSFYLHQDNYPSIDTNNTNNKILYEIKTAWTKEDTKGFRFYEHNGREHSFYGNMHYVVHQGEELILFIPVNFNLYNNIKMRSYDVISRVPKEEIKRLMKIRPNWFI